MNLIMSDLQTSRPRAKYAMYPRSGPRARGGISRLNATPRTSSAHSAKGRREETRRNADGRTDAGYITPPRNTIATLRSIVIGDGLRKYGTRYAKQRAISISGNEDAAATATASRTAMPYTGPLMVATTTAVVVEIPVPKATSWTR